MHRMRRFSVLLGVVATVGLSSTLAAPASASLLKPGAGRAYPDIAADINGSVTYTYNAATETGVFQVYNTPYLMAGGPLSSQEYLVQANADTGIRSQSISLMLDKNGQLIASAQNNYELYGTVVAEGHTYSGLLLRGVPTAFGSLDLSGVGVSGVDIFDVEVDITGGALASYFGGSAYMRITPELYSTFNGKFDESFSAAKATTNTRTYSAPLPFPIPEPSTFALLAVGIGGFALRARRHLSRRA